MLGKAVLAAAVVVAPGRAGATRFEAPGPQRRSVGAVGRELRLDLLARSAAYFDIDARSRPTGAGITAATTSRRWIANRRAAFDYVGDHLGKVPEIEGVRLLRIVGLYQPSKGITIDSFVEARTLGCGPRVRAVRRQLLAVARDRPRRSRPSERELRVPLFPCWRRPRVLATVS
jgi:hypothetical protein